MPGRNGTGPSGQGPMTGRGLGNCTVGNNGQSQPVENNAMFARGMGMGRGAGRGLGNGAGRGMGRGMNSGSGFGRKGR